MILKMKSLKVGLVLEIAEVEEATIKEVIGLGGEVRKEVIQMMIIITVEAVQEANTIEVEGDALIIEENLINNLI